MGAKWRKLEQKFHQMFPQCFTTAAKCGETKWEKPEKLKEKT
jgi:hypothetical protein